MAGVNACQPARRLMHRAGILTCRKRNELQRGGPACDVVAKTVALRRFDGLAQAAVEKLARFLVRKGELLAADFEQLLAHAQVSDTQLRQVARKHHQRQMIGLMTQEEAHRLMNNRIGDEMVIINHQKERARPVRQLDEKLRKKGREARVLAFLGHHFATGAVPAGRLLNSSDKIAGEALRLVIAFVKRIPAQLRLTCGPLGN